MKRSILLTSALITLISSFSGSASGQATTTSCAGAWMANQDYPTANSELFTWQTVPGIVGYEYVLDMSSATPSGPGTATVDTFYHATGLTPATTYYFHARVNCGSGNYSTWLNLPSFTTLPATSLGVSNVAGSGMLAYPNPVAGTLNLRNVQPGTQVVLFTVAGQQIMSFSEVNGSGSFDVSNLPGGIYLLRCITNDGVQTLRINKQ